MVNNSRGEEFSDEKKFVDDKKKFPTLVEIKRSIPKKCFESSVAKSMFFVVLDFAISFSLFGIMYFGIEQNLFGYIEKNPEDIVMNSFLYYFYWISLLTYCFFQGTIFWSFFSIGHDCGHKAFSKYQWLNDLMGHISHTYIFIPYHYWKISHRDHHKNTCNIDKDQIYYPGRSEKETMDEVVEEVAPKSLKDYLLNPPAYAFLGLIWLFYLSGIGKNRSGCHFVPLRDRFKEQIKNCIETSIWISCWSSVLGYSIIKLGWFFFTFYYFIPVLVLGTWLLVVTFLHHADDHAKWYSNGEWTYVKGNLGSIDRDYKMFHWITHNIGTHQIHHLFPIIPHYNLREATRHFRKAFPHLVNRSDENIIKAFFRMMYNNWYFFIVPKNNFNSWEFDPHQIKGTIPRFESPEEYNKPYDNSDIATKRPFPFD